MASIPFTVQLLIWRSIYDKKIVKIIYEEVWLYMGIILGFLCLLCFCMLLLKALTYRLNFKKLDKILMKIHKYVCSIFLVLLLLHIVFTLKVFQTRNFYIYISGLLAMATFILIIIFCHTQKDRLIKLKWHRILSVVTAFFIAIHILIYYIDFYNYQTNISTIYIKEIDVSNISDGKYIGEYDAGYIYTKVEVIIKNGKILNINLLEHKNERGKPAEKIVDKIMEENQINVDAVSGATNSSTVIKKAVENALIQSE